MNAQERLDGAARVGGLLIPHLVSRLRENEIPVVGQEVRQIFVDESQKRIVAVEKSGFGAVR